jgi:hypothetical protein
MASPLNQPHSRKQRAQGDGHKNHRSRDRLEFTDGQGQDRNRGRAVPDRTGWTRRYDGLIEGCVPIVRELNSAERAAMLLGEFNALVIGHGLDPMTVHREFLKIDEYRCLIPPEHRQADHPGRSVGKLEDQPCRGW